MKRLNPQTSSAVLRRGEIIFVGRARAKGQPQDDRIVSTDDSGITLTQFYDDGRFRDRGGDGS
jgi:hypothetical protein